MKHLKSILTYTLIFLCLVTSGQNIKADISNLSLPNIDWSLSLDLNNFEVSENNVSPDGNARQILANQESQALTVSVFIENADHDGNSVECRTFYWSQAEKSPLPKENLTQYEKNNIAFVEFDTKEFQGNKVDFHSMNAYLSTEGYWIDIHISKIGYKPEDKVLFDQIVNTIKIEKPKKRNVSELFIFGSQYYYQNNYKSAIMLYESILETEQEQITIDKTIWRIVVDNLGMAYGISGDLQNSKRIFDYGIKNDPEYPNFYYSLACTYAEMSDLDNTLTYLELAFQKKENVISGEELPNPKEDPSFQKYIKDEKFKKLLKKYKH
jgi:tetratricopeptide (TPR) repeat protein